MTNTSKIGSTYENAWRALQEDAGYHTTRAAASKGLFDVITYGTSSCYHAQLRYGRLSCGAASAYAASLAAEIHPSCRALVVHHTKRDPFCTHVG